MKREDRDIQHRVVFKTGRVYEFEMARNLLTDSNIPLYIREENFSGLRLATPSTPLAGPGTWYSILVPDRAFVEAKRILSELPFDIGTEPGFWHFGAGAKTRFGYKVYALIVLAVSFLLFIFYANDLFK